MRAVLDPNVLISALLAPRGAPAELLRRWEAGEFELVASPLLLAELERALGYPTLRRRVSVDEAAAVIRWLRGSAEVHDDPEEPGPVVPEDPDDAYLVALASSQRSVLVSGDRHLLALADDAPVHSPRQFLDILTSR